MEEFVTYEIAFKLKEKGFKEQCLAYYTKDSNFYYNTSYGSDVESAFKSFNSRPNHICGKRIDAPIISQVLKWLREEKNISVQPSSIRGNRWESQITFTDENDKKLVEKFLDGSFWAGRRSKTYEEAALAGIQYVIDNLI